MLTCFVCLVAVIDFLKYFGCYACGTMRTSLKFRDRAALYLRSMAFGIGRLYFLSQTRGAWLASSLASLGASLGPKGKRRSIMPGLSKELVETTHGLRSRGVTKVGQVVLGYEVARKGGHVKRGMSLADLASPSKVPNTDCVGTASSLKGRRGGFKP